SSWAPKRFDHTCWPVAESLTRKMSVPPALVRGPPPKSTVPKNDPVNTTLPLPSTAMSVPLSDPVPPNLWDHRWGPSPAHFATKMSVAAGVVRGPPPKSTVPKNDPVNTTLPLPSTAMSVPLSDPVPPNLWDHRWVPSAAYFATKMSFRPALTSCASPKLAEFW